jgi:hypothetical protein
MTHLNLAGIPLRLHRLSHGQASGGTSGSERIRMRAETQPDQVCCA